MTEVWKNNKTKENMKESMLQIISNEPNKSPKWIYYSLFSILCQRRSCCWKYRKWGSHLKNSYHYAKLVVKARIIFSIIPYCHLLFSRNENLKFLEVALTTILCNKVDGCIMKMWGSLSWSTVKTTADIYLLFKKQV